jgi:V/A-type H+/Na+-transporting ATPase subunit G/H
MLNCDWKDDFMSLESIKKITDTEQTYKEKKQEAQAVAQKLVCDAERDGKNRLEKARLQAESEARTLLGEAEEEAAVRAAAMMKDAEIQCDRLRDEAEKRLDKAAELIVERIVTGEWLS